MADCVWSVEEFLMTITVGKLLTTWPVLVVANARIWYRRSLGPE